MFGRWPCAGGERARPALEQRSFGDFAEHARERRQRRRQQGREPGRCRHNRRKLAIVDGGGEIARQSVRHCGEIGRLTNVRIGLERVHRECRGARQIVREQGCER